MNISVKSILSLTAICAVVAILMAATNFITAPIIEANDAAAANEALLVVMPDGEGFEAVDVSTYTLPATVNEVYKETNGGYVVKLTTTGYSSGMVIMIGIDGSGAVTGATCLGSAETLGYEKTYGETTVGATLETVDSLDTVGGATKTTGAYKNAVKDALNTAVIMGGGTVDIRTPEQILADNLNEALPAGEGAFTAWFITEELDSVDAVYVADNGAGYVFVSGDSYVGVDASGALVGEDPTGVIASQTAKVIEAMSGELTEVSLEGMDVPTQVLAVYKTASGNYVFELKASGFGINGDEWYSPSGEYIYIKLSATPSGKIISCVTTSQAETDGIGSACADASFYSQFDGKDEASYKDIDAISGATITTNGYKTAVGKIFEVIKMLEGVA